VRTMYTFRTGYWRVNLTPKNISMKYRCGNIMKLPYNPFTTTLENKNLDNSENGYSRTDFSKIKSTCTMQFTESLSIQKKRTLLRTPTSSKLAVLPAFTRAYVSKIINSEPRCFLPHWLITRIPTVQRIQIRMMLGPQTQNLGSINAVRLAFWGLEFGGFEMVQFAKKDSRIEVHVLLLTFKTTLRWHVCSSWPRTKM
jgi:hypothetical protein